MSLDEAFSILGINENMTFDEMRKTYGILAKQNHPDLNNTDDKKMVKINLAWKRIRKEYPDGKVIPRKKDNYSSNFSYQSYEPKDDPIDEEIYTKREELRVFIINEFNDLQTEIADKSTNIAYQTYYKLVEFIRLKSNDYINEIKSVNSLDKLNKIKEQVNVFIFDFCVTNQISTYSNKEKIDFYKYLERKKNKLTSIEYQSIYYDLKRIDGNTKEFDQLIERFNSIIKKDDLNKDEIKNQILMDADLLLNQTNVKEEKDKITKSIGVLLTMIDNAIDKKDLDDVKAKKEIVFFDLITEFNLKPLSHDIKYSLYELLLSIKNSIPSKEYDTILINLKHAKTKEQYSSIENQINNIKSKSDSLKDLKQELTSSLTKKVSMFNYNDFIEETIFKMGINPSDIPIDNRQTIVFNLRKKMLKQIDKINRTQDLIELQLIDIDDIYNEIIEEVRSQCFLVNQM